ncbi:hypothetical protein AG1IA_07078 [Rhizoctonia solani AG-1 IA]|uniref:Uncharacterized protein n=1 Tax=Thanatephorus cucumeris (strain AG1-IA) TaxID=983506 RepID=L8WQ48_THACA|nr:hypothetical protein AG1IA_07078 [Rhizoctonia solani AG-1 IA]
MECMHISSSAANNGRLIPDPKPLSKFIASNLNHEGVSHVCTSGHPRGSPYLSIYHPTGLGDPFNGFTRTCLCVQQPCYSWRVSHPTPQHRPRSSCLYKRTGHTSLGGPVS